MTSKVQRVASFLFVLPGVMFVALRVGGQAPPASADLPSGWHVYADGKVKNANEYDRRCFNFSRNEWNVTVEGVEVRIAKNIRRQEEVPALPPRLVHQYGMTSLQSATRLNDGWLLAYNGGEFGGGLWLTSSDGGDVKQILNEDVHAVVIRDDSVVVLSGLAHMTGDSGRAWFYALPRDLGMALQRSIKLDGAPGAYTKGTDGSVTFTTTHSLNRITKEGELQTLHEFPKWMAHQYPNSIALLPNGTVYVGMRMFVLRLKNYSGEFSEEWLLPDECRRFTLNESKPDCVCSPRRFF
jgi:hypothetical protein